MRHADQNLSLSVLGQEGFGGRWRVQHGSREENVLRLEYTEALSRSFEESFGESKNGTRIAKVTFLNVGSRFCLVLVRSESN